MKSQSQVELLLGSETGVCYVYDPFLIDHGNVIKFNNLDGIRKQRRVIMVKWFEAIEEGENPNKFIVVFDDGTLYVFFKECDMDNKQASKTI